MKYHLQYTLQAKSDIIKLYSYLQDQWGNKALEKLDSKIEKVLDSICINPLLFPIIKGHSVRCCVITSQLKLYYTIKGDTVVLLTFFDVRQHPTKLQAKL